MSMRVQRTTEVVTSEPSAEILSEVSRAPVSQDSPEMDFTVTV